MGDAIRRHASTTRPTVWPTLSFSLSLSFNDQFRANVKRGVGALRINASAGRSGLIKWQGVARRHGIRQLRLRFTIVNSCARAPGASAAKTTRLTPLFFLFLFINPRLLRGPTRGATDTVESVFFLVASGTYGIPAKCFSFSVPLPFNNQASGGIGFSLDARAGLTLITLLAVDAGCGRATPRYAKKTEFLFKAFHMYAFHVAAATERQSHYGNVGRSRKRDLGDRC